MFLTYAGRRSRQRKSFSIVNPDFQWVPASLIALSNGSRIFIRQLWADGKSSNLEYEGTYFAFLDRPKNM